MRLPQFPTLVVCAALLVLVVASPLPAQQPASPSLSVTTSAGLAFVPDALGNQCGRNGGGRSTALEVGGSVIGRVWRQVIVQGDLRAAVSPLLTGCTLVGFEVDTSYALTGERGPLSSSALRVGVETPASWPLLRATAGVGRVWGAPTLPVTVLGLATGTRGARVRFLLEAEWLQARAPAEEVRRTPPSRRRVTVRPWWTAVRAGVEIPLRR